MRSIATAALLSFIATAASAAGTVNVTFVDPDSFYDAGNSKRDVPGNLNELELHLQQLGQKYLPDGQVLSISVLDVDLAGYMKPLSSRAGREVRIARREANWPRFKIRYTLEAPGQAVKNVEEVVADMNYGRHGQMNIYSDRDPLRFEKMMLDRWFQLRFSPDY